MPICLGMSEDMSSARRKTHLRGPLLALAVCSITGFSGCAVVSVAASATGAVVSVAGSVVSTGVDLTGKVIGKTIDVVTPGSSSN
ncbi:MAG: hypothetical protein JWP52_1977 [Rhizobacter sp.]|nr:hypothetical protein [Rhizobacter sp.]